MTGMINGKWNLIFEDTIARVTTIRLAASLNSPFAQPRCLAVLPYSGASLVAALCTGTLYNLCTNCLQSTYSSRVYTISAAIIASNPSQYSHIC